MMRMMPDGKESRLSDITSSHLPSMYPRRNEKLYANKPDTYKSNSNMDARAFVKKPPKTELKLIYITSVQLRA